MIDPVKGFKLDIAEGGGGGLLGGGGGAVSSAAAAVASKSAAFVSGVTSGRHCLFCFFSLLSKTKRQGGCMCMYECSCYACMCSVPMYV